MKEEQKNTLVHAINHFGVEGQINKAVEEMAELITELARRNLSRFDKDRVAEEVADALVMLEQLRIIFGASKVDGYIAEKLERLEKTINGDWRRQERMMPPGMVVHSSGGVPNARVPKNIAEALGLAGDGWAQIEEKYREFGCQPVTMIPTAIDPFIDPDLRHLKNEEGKTNE